MHKLIPPIVLVSIFLISQESLPLQSESSHIYETGTKFVLNIKWWGLSAVGTMDIVGNSEFRGRDVLLVRSQVTELGGFLGFIARFLKMYKGANTFDSYIDPDTSMTVRYEIYKLKKDGSKETIDHVYFDREANRIVSLEDNKTIVDDVSPDIQDIYSAFLALLYNANTEGLFPGKKYELEIYGYMKAFQVEVEVTRQEMQRGVPVYTLEIAELPEIFKYPASVISEFTDTGAGIILPTGGECTINLRLLPDMTVKAEFRKVSN